MIDVPDCLLEETKIKPILSIIEISENLFLIRNNMDQSNQGKTENEVEQVFDPEENYQDDVSTTPKDVAESDDIPIIPEAEREIWERKRNVGSLCTRLLIK